jgi:MYXO-CTERM domain-containing protein
MGRPKTMRALLVTAMALLALLAPTPAHAAGTALLQDAKGDAKLSIDAMGTPLPPQQGATDASANADLLALEVGETEDALSFSVSVASLKGDPADTSVDVWFSWSDRDFLASLSYFSSPTLGGEGGGAYLYAVEDEDDWSGLGPGDFQVDADKGILTGTFAKVYILDEKDRTPGKGDTLSGLRVVSESLSINFGVSSTTHSDAMPDDEGGAASYVLQMGDFSTGSLRLSSPERVRVSNGGSTTFVYLVEVANVADVEHEYDIGVADLPEGWNASVQSPVRVPAKSERNVAILASVPFAHTHGGFDAFNVTVESKTDAAAKGRMRFGVLHTPVPQPAGHHPDLFLHAFPRSQNPINDAFGTVEPYGRPYMNTDPAHEGDSPIATANYWSGMGAGWYIPLSPTLRMGLDFDIEKTATLVGTIQNSPLGELTLSASLLLYRDGEETVLAEAEDIAATGDPQKPLPFAFTLTPTEDAEYVPHRQEQYLGLLVMVEAPQSLRLGGTTSPRLVTEDFKLTLPLEEYHDRLTGVADAASILDLKTEGPVEKAGRPGTIVTYVFDLVNGGSTADTFEMDLAGSDARRAQVVPSGAVALGAGETKRVTVAVSIPSDAAAGEELEVLLFAHGVDDPGKTAIARTKTKVSLGDDAVADESAVLTAAREAENETPGPGLALVAVGLLGAALAMRRRRA